MPKRTDIQSILILGAGPIVIGQACEFDYSGAQACKALREEGYRVILVNSNPATIMTDPVTADHIYLLPLTVESLDQILTERKIDAVLATMGGQTALNLAIEAGKQGLWEKHNCRLIGVDLEAIELAENREEFKKHVVKLGQNVAPSFIANSYLEGKEAAQKIAEEIQKRYHFEIHFPFKLSTFLQAMRLLPYRLSLAMTKKMLP